MRIAYLALPIHDHRHGLSNCWWLRKPSVITNPFEHVSTRFANFCRYHRVEPHLRQATHCTLRLLSQDCTKPEFSTTRWTPWTFETLASRLQVVFVFAPPRNFLFMPTVRKRLLKRLHKLLIKAVGRGQAFHSVSYSVMLKQNKTVVN